MNSIAPENAAAARRRRRQATAIKESLRELSNQLALLNRRAGLHPATMTGILDRLERGGWVSRDRDPGAADRRAVTIRIRRDRAAEIFRLYSGMNTLMDQILTGYSEAELELLAGFVRRTAEAGREATEQLAEGQ